MPGAEALFRSTGSMSRCGRGDADVTCPPCARRAGDLAQVDQLIEGASNSLPAGQRTPFADRLDLLRPDLRARQPAVRCAPGFHPPTAAWPRCVRLLMQAASRSPTRRSLGCPRRPSRLRCARCYGALPGSARAWPAPRSRLRWPACMRRKAVAHRFAADDARVGGSYSARPCLPRVAACLQSPL